MGSVHEKSRNHCSIPYVIFLGAVAALGGLLFGFDLAIIVGAGPFLSAHFNLSDLGLGWVYSSLLFGCIFGAALAGSLTDRFGRKRLLLIVAATFAASSLVTGLAPDVPVLIVARFLGGLAVGAVSILSPLYVAEVAPKNIRGRMGAAYQMSITSGILISYLINFGLRNLGSTNWRWMFISGCLPSLLFVAVLLGAPETPRYLFISGRKKEACEVLGRIVSQDELNVEAAEIEESLRNSGREISIKDPRLRRVLALTLVLAVLVHVSGIDTVIDYLPLMLKSEGWTIDTALLSTFLIGSVNFAFTAISFWTIDRFGRRALYVVGSLGMFCSLFLLCIRANTGQLAGPASIFLFAMFIAFFASCIGPAFWTLIPELFPNRARGRLMMLPVITQWLTNATVVLLFPLLFHRVGPSFTFPCWRAWPASRHSLRGDFCPKLRALPSKRSKRISSAVLFGRMRLATKQERQPMIQLI